MELDKDAAIAVLKTQLGQLYNQFIEAMILAETLARKLQAYEGVKNDDISGSQVQRNS